MADKVKTGRPTKGTEQSKKDVLAHVKAGLSIEQTAQLMHIVKSTIYEWKKADKEFSNLLDELKDDTIQAEVKRQIRPKELVKIMAKKASGFHYTETKREYDADNILIKTTKQERYCPPDIEACNKLIELSGEKLQANIEDNTLNIKIVGDDGKEAE